VTSGPQTIVRDIGEEGLIRIFSVKGAALGGKVLVPNGDDAAAWFVEPRYASVVTTDTQVEGVHFDFGFASPIAIGRKLVAVNLSDIAAMGARPRYLLLSVCIAPDVQVATIEKIAQGIKEMCKLYGVAVIGGNTTSTSGPMILGATLIGRAEPDELVRRRGAQVGDAIFVTGQLGDAKAGLHMVQSGHLPDRDSPYSPLYRALTDPVPRVEVGRRLAQHSLPNAMCDVSDGLGRDLRRLLVPEGLGGRLEAGSFPISSPMRNYCEHRGVSPEAEAMLGGEDYELLFTADPSDTQHVVDICSRAATPVARIGTVTVSRDIEVLLPDGSVEDVPTGFQHYDRV
jgi:thiamine-monophosphate kinase